MCGQVKVSLEVNEVYVSIYAIETFAVKLVEYYLSDSRLLLNAFSWISYLWICLMYIIIRLG